MIKRVLSVIAVAGWLGMFVLCEGAQAQKSCESWISRVVSVQGRVVVKSQAESSWQQASLDDFLCPGDHLWVDSNSRAAVVLRDESVLRLDQNTTLVFNTVEKDKNLLIRLFEGAVQFFSRAPRRLKVITPYVNGVVKGTEFLVRVDKEQTGITLFEGQLLAENETGSLLLKPGQTAAAREGQPPLLQTVVSPRDAVSWALSYPPTIFFSQADFQQSEEGGWQAAVRKSIGGVSTGDLIGAFAAVEMVDHGSISDPRFFIYLAHLNLAVGRVQEAEEYIAVAEKLNPGDSDIFALKTVMAVTQNRRDEALALAEQSLRADTPTAAAWIASSYAHQASFNLERALGDARTALKVSPDNAVVQARMSDLLLATGDLAGGLSAAQKTAELAPHLAAAHSSFGFAYLTMVKLEEAKQSFTTAIGLDSSLPMPRFGLGLVKIRQGDVAGGREDLEIAAALDPNNSLLRSYLGKAYFEEKRGGLDSRQFDLAKQLDPNDPTPWLYDAIRKQSINQPVAALKDLEKSIALNDNRAVYRSRFMLDEDLASRSTSLGRIYNDLDFELLALSEGWKSINIDPSNYSAHRFLADSYAALPRHEIARVSEVLQAQLLQPINLSPVSPLLAESNLLQRDGIGAVTPSFNEFGQLFNRNRASLHVSGIVGENDNLGGEIVPSLVWNNISASLGLYHSENEGFRQNNDQEHDIADFFAQMAVSPQLSLMAQYRKSDKEFGDLPLRFDPDYFFPGDRNSEEISTLRVGGSYAFSVNSRILATAVKGDATVTFEDPYFGLDIEEEDDGYMIEAQHHLRMGNWYFITGAGYFDSEDMETTRFEPFPAIINEVDSSHANLYLYSHVEGPGNTTWTIGASGDSFDESTAGSDQFNPKLGLIWDPLAGTTLRGAVFRTLQRSLVAEQTVEPTQVAGFNQFYQDGEGTDSWHYGLAWDQRFPASFYGGAALIWRDMTVPYTYLDAFNPFGGIESRSADWDDLTLRCYLYWTPLDQLALSAEYSYEDLQRDETLPGDGLYRNIQTHRIPLGINYFHPSGLIGRVKATHIRQEGDFGDPFFGYESDSDDFWVVDAEIGFRLPKRLGMITLEARNLFDQSFNFQDTDPANPRVSPEQTILLKASFAF